VGKNLHQVAPHQSARYCNCFTAKV